MVLSVGEPFQEPESQREPGSKTPKGGAVGISCWICVIGLLGFMQRVLPMFEEIIVNRRSPVLETHQAPKTLSRPQWPP